MSLIDEVVNNQLSTKFLDLLEKSTNECLREGFNLHEITQSQIGLMFSMFAGMVGGSMGLDRDTSYKLAEQLSEAINKKVEEYVKPNPPNYFSDN